MSVTVSLWLSLVLALVLSVCASPADLWQRYQQRERARQAMDLGPYSAGLMMDQYYPLWAQAAVLQLDEPSGRLTEPEERLADDDYGYDLAQEQPAYVYGDEGDNVATGVEEQVYKDLLLRYLLREMEKQETLPVVRRRSEYKVRQVNAEPQAPAPSAAPSSTTSTSTSSTTSTTTKAPASQSRPQQGQKEVALLRPPSDNRHRPLTWPQELENRQTPQSDNKKAQDKRTSVSRAISLGDETAALPTAPKKHPKEAFDILTAQLNSLRSRAH